MKTETQIKKLEQQLNSLKASLKPQDDKSQEALKFWTKKGFMVAKKGYTKELNTKNGVKVYQAVTLVAPNGVKQEKVFVKNAYYTNVWA